MKCPICQKPIKVRENNPFRPFCSERCKLVDLGKWLDGKYVIPNDQTTLSSDASGEDDD